MFHIIKADTQFLSYIFDTFYSSGYKLTDSIIFIQEKEFTSKEFHKIFKPIVLRYFIFHKNNLDHSIIKHQQNTDVQLECDEIKKDLQNMILSLFNRTPTLQFYNDAPTILSQEGTSYI
eukprot:snap_masked-scaffold_23-processed-gene-0.51-mRNA-1 protein AED:1.00 eAED:1.00 QI:0/-1/0/0/-1/1/1/0/118